MVNILVSDGGSGLEREIAASLSPSVSPLSKVPKEPLQPQVNPLSSEEKPDQPRQSIDAFADDAVKYETFASHSKLLGSYNPVKQYVLDQVSKLYAGFAAKKEKEQEYKKQYRHYSPLPSLKEHVWKQAKQTFTSLSEKLRISISGRPTLNAVGEERYCLLSDRKRYARIASGRSRFSSSSDGGYAGQSLGSSPSSSRNNYAFQG